jgi:multiple sugar transport system substrate-binding protein
MQFLSSKENQARYCESTSYIPPRKDSADSGAIWSEDPIMKVYKQQLEQAKARGPHPQWPQISSAIQFAVQDSLAGTKSVEQALREASVEIGKIK